MFIYNFRHTLPHILLFCVPLMSRTLQCNLREKERESLNVYIQFWTYTPRILLFCVPLMSQTLQCNLIAKERKFLNVYIQFWTYTPPDTPVLYTSNVSDIAMQSDREREGISKCLYTILDIHSPIYSCFVCL